MSGNPSSQQISNIGLLSAASTSNFFPNSISSIVEDTPSTKTNSLVALRVSNLPRDLQLREFNVLFTFAPEFVYAELLQSPALADDGLPASVVGIGYFKSLPAASNAMAVLTRNPLIFAPREIFNRPNVSTSSYILKCDIRTNVRQNEAVRGLSYNLSPQQQASHQQQSQQQQQQQQHNSTSPVALLPQQPQQNVGPFKGSSSRFVFPSGGISTPQMELGAQNYSEAYNEPSGVLSPPSVFSPTSPRSIFPGEPEFMARISGKSLLLESQGKEDEEYNSMVKDPMGWFNMNNSYSVMPESNPSSVGYSGSAPLAPGGQSAQLPKPKQGTQPGQAQQAPVQSQSGLSGNHQSGSSNKESSSKTSSPSSGSNSKSARNSISGAAPVNNNNSNGNGPSNGPSPWNDKRRGSTIRSFQNLSVSNDNNNKNGTFSPSSTASNTNTSTSTAGSSSTSSNNNGSNGNSNDNNSNNSNNSSSASSAPVILPGGATRVLPPANPADQNPPCNTLYVGNLPPDTNEEELKDLFSARQGYKRLCFRTKANGPMCFVEFEDVSYAGQALEQLYGVTLSNSVKGGIRLSYSKNPLGVRSSTTASGSNQSRISSGNGGGNGNYGASRNYNNSNNY